MSRINLAKVIIVPKKSKFELDMEKFKLGPAQLIEKYQREGADAGRIVQSHERQQRSLRDVAQLFDKGQFVPREQFTKEIAAAAELVISLGGDDHVKFVSHFLDATPILGVNSDEVKSDGGLTYFTAEGFSNVLRRLELGEFQIEEWTRLEVCLFGFPVGLATSEVFLGEQDREMMSRYVLAFEGRQEEQKNSGLLVVTGAGSTGWYDAACRYLHMDGSRFPKTVGYARFLATEPFKGRVGSRLMEEGVLERGQELVVHSLNDTEGILSIDSIDRSEFNRGAKAVIRIAEASLMVVSMGAGG